MNAISKTMVVILMVGLSLIGLAQNSNGQIKGLVLDDNHNPAIGALVKVTQGGIVMKQTVTDVDGYYTVAPLQAGTYEVLVSYTGFKISRYKNVVVEAEATAYVDSDLEVNVLGEATVYAEKVWEKPIVDVSYITMHKLTYDQLSKMAVAKGDIKGMISNISPDILVSKSGQVYSRGSRAGSSKYYVDGELLPFDQDVTGMSIQTLSVITGGIPAQFGDLTGAAIVVTTKDYFSGMAEKNMRNRSYQERIKKEKEEAEYEAMKKKREEEIEKEKQAEKEQMQQGQ